MARCALRPPAGVGGLAHNNCSLIHPRSDGTALTTGMRVRGYKRPNLLASLPYWLVFWLHRRTHFRVEVTRRQLRCIICCSSMRALRRATTLFAKEAGTVSWLEQELHPGDVFLDIGANIGIYSLLAAQMVGAEGRVFGIEPHAVNAAALLENIAANHVADRVSVLTIALSSQTGFDRFNYHDWEAARSHSQFGRNIDENGCAFIPVCAEVKYGTTVDALVADSVIGLPHAVKIDIDGLELSVLRGMAKLLTDAQHPRSVQVEVGPASYTSVDDLMKHFGYRLDYRHHTLAGKKRLRAGAEELSVPHNAVYKPR